MTKYQIRTFKFYVQTIEAWSRDYEMAWQVWDKDKPTTDIKDLYNDLKEIKIAFFNWFARQLELEKLKTIRNLSKRKPTGKLMIVK